MKSNITSSRITPVPNDEEAVALVAAMEALWPRPVIGADPVSARENAWRFSGRWWARPQIARRARPW